MTIRSSPLLAPGVLPGTPRLASVGFKGAINVNGNRVFNNVFLLDGVDNISYSNSFRGENVQLVQPSIEALQEFKIQTNAYSAEYGRSSGAVVNATIKSGTNRLRGSVYEFFRNDKLDATNFFSNALGQPKPKRERNQFGAAAGGPLVKNRTFWFADYEGLRDKEGIPRTRLVPTEAEKGGVFGAVVVDPFAPGRPAFSQNAQGQWVIPSDRWDPVGAAIVALIPPANATAGGQPVYASTPVTDTRQDQFDVRIDHQMASNFTVFGRYSFVDTLTFRPAPLPELGEGSFNDAFGSNDNRSQGLALGATWTVSPTLVGDIRFGASRGDYYTSPPNAGVDGPAQIGLKNVPNDPAIVGGIPKVNIQGFDAVGRHTSTPQFQTPRTWNPRATFTLIRGSHLVKFGAEFLDVSTRINDLNATIGRMNFENRFTNRAVGDLLLGLPSQLALTSFTVMDQGQKMQFYFVQDDYRVSKTLTANVGLRYEYATPPVEKNNQFANFDPATGTMIFAKDGSLFERALIHPDRNNFAPRIGFAYTPVSKMVVRGGYGIFYTHTVRQGREGLLGFNPPYLIDNLLQSGASGAAAVASAAPFRLVNGYPEGILDPGALAQTVGRRAQDANQRTPYVQQYNAGVQYELMPDVVLDVAFVGNKGTKLQRVPQPEPARRDHQSRWIAGGRRPPLSRTSATSSGWRIASAPPTGRCRRASRSASRRACRRWSATPGARRSPARRITSRRAAAARDSTPAYSANHRTATTCALNTVPPSSTSRIVSSPAMSGSCRSATAVVSEGTGRARRNSSSGAGSSPASTWPRAVWRSPPRWAERPCSTSEASGEPGRTSPAIRCCLSRNGR